MMAITKTLMVSIALMLTTTASISLADGSRPANTAAKEDSLKLVMQGLLADTQRLTAAVLVEDFASIEKIAKNIAEHPKPSMETRMKLMKAMGADMVKFKGNDGVVHDAAVAMVKSAQNKDMQTVGNNFKTLIAGCLNCHGEFKAKVSALLK